MSRGQADRSRPSLHPKNRHQGRYDFKRLLAADASLAKHLVITPRGEASINFADPAAVLALNGALLKDQYGVVGWQLPPDSLCPPVPGRADYLHHLDDLLAERNGGVAPPGARVQVLDIGTGASCIYPLLGASALGWGFVATDINPESLGNAQAILEANPRLACLIRLRQQTHSSAVLDGVIGVNECFDLTMCNPPFHPSLAAARAASARKWKNLGRADLALGRATAAHGRRPSVRHQAHGSAEGKVALNFGGQGAELWCPGGELRFIQTLIRESARVPSRAFWFSTLVSQSDHLPALDHALTGAGVVERRTVLMGQGQKISRLLAWTFLSPQQQAAWRQRRWQVPG